MIVGSNISTETLFSKIPATAGFQEAERLVDGGLDDWLRTWCNDEVPAFLFP